MSIRVNKLLLGIILSLISYYSFADCQVSLSQRDVKYGKIQGSDISKTVKNWSSLTERSVKLIAYCTQPEKMALFFIGKTGENGAFSFGDQSGLIIEASSATLDGHSVTLSHTDIHGSFTPMGYTGSKLPLRANQGLIPVRGGQVLAGQEFSVNLTLKPVMKTHQLAVKDKYELSSHINIHVETE
jgi:hypothetical protein